MTAVLVSAAELHAQGEKAEGPGNFTSKRIQAPEGDSGQTPAEFTKSSKVRLQASPPSTLRPLPSALRPHVRLPTCLCSCLHASKMPRRGEEGRGSQARPTVSRPISYEKSGWTLNIGILFLLLGSRIIVQVKHVLLPFPPLPLFVCITLCHGWSSMPFLSSLTCHPLPSPPISTPRAHRAAPESPHPLSFRTHPTTSRQHRTHQPPLTPAPHTDKS